MLICQVCNNHITASTSYDSIYTTICMDCYKKLKTKELTEKSNNYKEACDFKSWSGDDLSELFWIHLGIYKQHPNKRSLRIIKMIFNWSVHANHTLSNSIDHALKWVLKVDNLFKHYHQVYDSLPETECEEVE